MKLYQIYTHTYIVCVFVLFNDAVSCQDYMAPVLDCLLHITGGMKKKVKFTLVQALRLCTGRTTHRGSRGIALLFHDQRQ